MVDPIRPEARGILKLAESFVVHLAPVRLGIVFDTSKGIGEENNLYRSIICAFNYLTQTKTPRDALGFLTDVSKIPAIFNEFILTILFCLAFCRYRR